MLTRSQLLGWYPGPYPNPGILPYAGIMSARDVREQWQAFLSESPRSSDILLYVHIPYCVRICSMCDCSRDEWNADVHLDGYLDYLEAEMDFFADTFSGRRFRSLYIGGGTPNLLSAEQIRRLSRMIF